jgi:hypothetical protein
MTVTNSQPDDPGIPADSREDDFLSTRFHERNAGAGIVFEFICWSLLAWGGSFGLYIIGRAILGIYFQ